MMLLTKRIALIPSRKIHHTFASLQLTLIFLRYLVKVSYIKLHRTLFLKEQSLKTVRNGDKRAEGGTGGQTETANLKGASLSMWTCLKYFKPLVLEMDI